MAGGPCRERLGCKTDVNSFTRIKQFTDGSDPDSSNILTLFKPLHSSSLKGNELKASRFSAVYISGSRSCSETEGFFSEMMQKSQSCHGRQRKVKTKIRVLFKLACCFKVLLFHQKCECSHFSFTI